MLRGAAPPAPAALQHPAERLGRPSRIPAVHVPTSAQRAIPDPNATFTFAVESPQRGGPGGGGGGSVAGLMEADVEPEEEEEDDYDGDDSRVDALMWPQGAPRATAGDGRCGRLRVPPACPRGPAERA